jgi:hypothetical protein
MRTFLITYDLAKPNRNKHALASAIMGLGTAWARPLENTWYVRADIREDNIEARLGTLLDTDDGLLVQAVETPASLMQTSLRWFKQRRPGFDVETGSNVIAFPLAQVSDPQAELPLSGDEVKIAQRGPVKAKAS